MGFTRAPRQATNWIFVNDAGQRLASSKPGMHSDKNKGRPKPDEAAAQRSAVDSGAFKQTADPVGAQISISARSTNPG